MSYSISTLLTRNLHDVFGENDPARRQTAIDEIFTEDCVSYDPMGGVYRDRDGIDQFAGALRATHPDFCFKKSPVLYHESGSLAYHDLALWNSDAKSKNRRLREQPDKRAILQEGFNSWKTRDGSACAVREIGAPRWRGV